MERSVVLDICKHPDPPVPALVLRQGDGGSVVLRISLMEDGEPFDLSDCEARFMARLKNGKVVIDPCRKEGGNALSYTLPSALAAKAGTIELAYVAVYRGEDWIASTDRIRFQILEGVDVSAEEAEGHISEFDRLKERFEGLVEEAGEQKERQQEDWEGQMSAQQSAWQGQTADQQLSWQEQTDAQQALWESQAEGRQRQWLAQMTAQQAEFEEQEAARAEGESKRSAAEEERERAVADALASLGSVSVEPITDEDIDGLWSH